MFHLPITFSEVDRFLVEFAVFAATGISVYQFLHFKLRIKTGKTINRLPGLKIKARKTNRKSRRT